MAGVYALLSNWSRVACAMFHVLNGVAALGLRVHPRLPVSLIIHVLSRKSKIPQAMRVCSTAQADWLVSRKKLRQRLGMQSM